MCILNKKGFIKIFAQDYYRFNIENYGFDFNDDIVLKFEIHYSYLIWRNQKRINYWGTKIKFENKGNEFNPKFVNLKLLDKLITSTRYRNALSKKIL
jgi:hypothetical protein